MNNVELQAQLQTWFTENVLFGNLQKKLKATMDYKRQFDAPGEESEQTVHAFEVVSGTHAEHTVQQAIKELLYHTLPMPQLSEDDVHAHFDLITSEVPKLCKAFLREMPGQFHIGHNEADGSIGIFYTEQLKGVRS